MGPWDLTNAFVSQKLREVNVILILGHGCFFLPNKMAEFWTLFYRLYHCPNPLARVPVRVPARAPPRVLTRIPARALGPGPGPGPGPGLEGGCPGLGAWLPWARARGGHYVGTILRGTL